MFLGRLEAKKASHLNWPDDCAEKPERLTRLFDVCDQTLNSWQEAHAAFELHQGFLPKPTSDAHRAFIRMCRDAINAESVSRYGMEIIAHAVLKVWIANKQVEARNRNIRR